MIDFVRENGFVKNARESLSRTWQLKLINGCVSVLCFSSLLQCLPCQTRLNPFDYFLLVTKRTSLFKSLDIYGWKNKRKPSFVVQVLNLIQFKTNPAKFYLFRNVKIITSSQSHMKNERGELLNVDTTRIV